MILATLALLFVPLQDTTDSDCRAYMPPFPYVGACTNGAARQFACKHNARQQFIDDWRDNAAPHYETECEIRKSIQEYRDDIAMQEEVVEILEAEIEYLYTDCFAGHEWACRTIAVNHQLIRQIEADIEPILEIIEIEEGFAAHERVMGDTAMWKAEIEYRNAMEECCVWM